MPKEIPKNYGPPRARTRERGGFSITSSAFGIVNGSPNGETYGTLETGTYTKTRDAVVPGFKKRVAKGEVFFNLFDRQTIALIGSGGTGRTLVKRDGTSGSIVTAGGGAGSAEMRYFLGGYSKHDPIPILSGNAISEAAQFVGTQTASNRGRSSNNLWEDLAQFDQTVGMLRNPLKAWHTFNKRFSKGIDGFAAERFAADLWLQYQYGIKPLVSSIEGIVKGLDKPRKSTRQTYRGSAKLSENTNVVTTFNDFNVHCDIRRVTTDTATLRGMSLDEFYADFGHNIGFTTKGFLTLPWELVRLSFVVDWFLNIGDFIGAHVPTPGFKQLGSCLVIERNITQTYTIENFDTNRPGYGDVWVPSVAPSFEYTVFLDSKVRTTLPQPGGVQLNPNFAFEQWPRVVTAIALVVQSLGGVWAAISKGKARPRRNPNANHRGGPRVFGSNRGDGPV